jgi:CheY-like chemotaxis protein
MSQSASLTEPETGTHRPRVLLVEDNEAALRGLSRLLEAKGYAVTGVRDGASALKALEAPPPPDYLLTDMRLPDLDGREVARQARQLVPAPWTALMTGLDLDFDRECQDTWGIDWVFLKPLDLNDLLGRLADRPERKPVGSGHQG